MPFNGSGSYILPAGNPVVNGTTISSNVQNNTMSDIAIALSDCLTRDGQSPATANIPMGGFKITGLGNSISTGQAATWDDIHQPTPIFSAYQSVVQILASSTWTKINFQTKEFDTTNAFDNLTNMRYTPLVAGYYTVGGGVSIGVSATAIGLAVYKNGVLAKYGKNVNTVDSGAFMTIMVYMNGTTDYLELWAYLTNSQIINATSTNTYFQAALISRA